MDNNELLKALSQIHTSNRNKKQAVILGTIAGLCIGGLIYYVYQHRDVAKELAYYQSKHWKYMRENNILVKSLQNQISDLNKSTNTDKI